MRLNGIIQVGNNIKIIRRENGITQSYMAQKLGIQRSTYSNYENNLREPKPETLEQIAKILDVNIEELIYRNTEKSKEETYDKKKIKSMSNDELITLKILIQSELENRIIFK